MNKQRIAGVEKEISRVLSRLFFEEIKNPKINGMVSVTKLRVAPDLKTAKVYLSVLDLRPGDNRAEIEQGFKEIRGFLRKRVSEEMSLRYIPEFTLILDDSIEYGVKINKMIKDLK